jgi:hypothetical protein
MQLHTPQVAGNVRLGVGWNKETINRARKPPSTRIKSRPLERNAIGHHFTGEIPGKGGGGAAVGRGHFAYDLRIRYWTVQQKSFRPIGVFSK